MPLDELNSSDWRDDDEFSWLNFYFIIVKEFLYGKKELEVFLRIWLITF